MADISFLGTKVTITSIPTFPQGFVVTEFADDAEPVSFERVQIRETAVGVNGEKVSWKKVALKPVSISVIPGSESDKNLDILYKANTPEKDKFCVDDNITMVVAYPNGTIKTCTGGSIVEGDPAWSGDSNGRIKTKTYNFVFEKII